MYFSSLHIIVSSVVVFFVSFILEFLNCPAYLRHLTDIQEYIHTYDFFKTYWCLDQLHISHYNIPILFKRSKKDCCRGNRLKCIILVRIATFIECLLNLLHDTGSSSIITLQMRKLKHWKTKKVSLGQLSAIWWDWDANQLIWLQSCTLNNFILLVFW